MRQYYLLTVTACTRMAYRMEVLWKNFKKEKTGWSIILKYVSIKYCFLRQITTLEILAISVGLSTFQEILKDRKVIIWTDNKGAEGSCRKGSAKAWDHCRLVHELWLHALQNHTHVWIERVPSHENIADSPSR